MKKFIIVSLLLCSLLFVPVVTFASWWNPMTWFEKPQDMQGSQIKQESPAESPSKTEEDTQPIIQEKIVTETITIDNPELQKRIDELIVENTTLKQQVSDESKTLSETATQYNDAVKKYNDLNSSVKIFGDLTLDMFKQLADKYNSCRSALGLAQIYLSTPSPVYYPPINHSINCTSSTIGGTTYTNCY